MSTHYVFFLVVLFLPVCHNYQVVAVFVEPVEMSWRKQGKTTSSVFLAPSGCYLQGVGMP